jgi:multiple sugar transport system substrate-binding protein
VKLTPLEKDPSPYPRFDRLLFYVSAAVLACALPFILRQFRPNVPFLGERGRVLVFTQWWQDEWGADVLPSLIREFEEQNPGVRVTLDTRPYHEIRRLLLEQEERPGPAAARSDILGLDPRWIPALIERDMLEPAEEAPEQDGEFGTAENGASPAASEVWPIVSWLLPLFYRIDLLQEAGFDRPPKTHAEFTAAARALANQPQGRYGFALSLSPEDPLGVYRDILPWFRSVGAACLRDGRPAFTEPPVATTLSFLNDLFQEGLLAPETFGKTNKDRIEDFSAGRLAMMIAPAGEIRNLRAAGVPFGVTALPGNPSYIGKPAAGRIGWYAGIPRSGKNKDEARAFLSFLVEKSEDIAVKTGMASETGANPAGEENALYLKINEIYAAADTTEAYLSLPAETALETILSEELRRMFEGGRTPDETALAVQQRWEAALE